jgi:hypothetical protein
MRPILGFLEHLGLNPESDDYKNHVKSLEDYLKKLENDGHIEHDVYSFISAARIELGISILSLPGIKPEQAFGQLSNPAEFNSLKLWIEKTLNSENIWESRAGFNLQQHYLDS